MSSSAIYYVPAQSRLPFLAAIAITVLLTAGGAVLNGLSLRSGETWPWLFFTLGSVLMLAIVCSWFIQVIRESHQGLYSAQMDRSYRWGMGWFIFSEVMFFAALFGALFYARMLAVPWLGSEGDKAVNALLWNEFIPTWPLFENPNEYLFPGPYGVIDPWGIPLLNTILLVASSFTLTWAHHALKQDQRIGLIFWMIVTIALGMVFLGFQAGEYIEAYQELGLTLDSGIYGATFFMLTGFHGIHVTLGTVMLMVMLLRILFGHFSSDKHFAFEAVAWYWHFVDVVWIGVFLCVYIL